MQNLWEALGASAGFYVTLAVCLLEAGISGYFLLDLGFIAWVLVRLYTPRKGETGNGAA